MAARMPARQVTAEEIAPTPTGGQIATPGDAVVTKPYVPDIEPYIVTQSTGESLRGYLLAGHVYFYGAADVVPVGARQIYVEKTDGPL